MDCACTFGIWLWGGGHHESRASAESPVGVGGLLFSAGIYPVAMELWHGNASNPGDDMMLSLYITLGIFLLLAARNPAAHGSLIAFTAWSSFAHAVVMSAIGFQPQYASERTGFWIGSGVLVILGVAFLALARTKQPVERTSTVPG